MRLADRMRDCLNQVATSCPPFLTTGPVRDTAAPWQTLRKTRCTIALGETVPADGAGHECRHTWREPKAIRASGLVQRRVDAMARWRAPAPSRALVMRQATGSGQQDNTVSTDDAHRAVQFEVMGNNGT